MANRRAFWSLYWGGVAFIAFLFLSALLLLHNYDLRIRINDMLVVAFLGIGASSIGTVLVRLKPEDRKAGKGLVLFWTASLLSSIAASRLWWWIYRDWGKPAWMLEFHSLWMFAVCASAYGIFVTLFAFNEEGAFLPRRWFWYFTTTAMASVTALSIIMLVRWYLGYTSTFF